ncbi:o-succinylbenzoate synthase [Saliterribacillus persicus]|uniref:o-succinylbenzoate synthase n=1 Tax=Saliterribacillus persicus TaxID=930114 RepID=A0A368YDQ8_9BACI|nr:o-succinylbenzoate synthase [Saliterribacillus persicus]RCW77476.1 O-succinylbenzoate synthase [Saliterribacillus persicus]
MTMRIKKLILHRLQMPLKEPFKNSLTTTTHKDFTLVELIDESGLRGFGETVAFRSPWYTEETSDSTRLMIEKHLCPIVKEQPYEHPSEFGKRIRDVRRNNMAKAAVEGALWDLYAKKENVPLYKLIGGVRSQVRAGVSIGMQDSISTVLEEIEQALLAGYERVKLKIKPGNDIALIEAVRNDYPDLALMVDANSAYTIDDIEHLKQLDKYNLLMIEQPLGTDDFVDHAKLQQQIETPICLDESIHTLSDVKTAITLGSCQIINMKLGRVGGFTEAVRIHDYCRENGIPLWGGGMLEAGVGRLQSLALATLDNFKFPADTAASDRYFKRDILRQPVEVDNGFIHLSESAGIGHDIDREALRLYRVEKKVLT